MPDILSPQAMLAKLVAFPTVSTETNLPLIEFVRDYLAEHGVSATLVPDATGAKASLFAQIGPAKPGGVLLSGHTDVVPTTGQDWTSDPYKLHEADGRLYGRGTCDMKGFIAIALALVPEMLTAGLKRPIQLALSYDEEIGCFGAPPMIEAMRTSLPFASAAIVGEPTLMQTVTGHKGVIELETRLRGYEVHSSLMHTGVSAVMTSARLIDWHIARNAKNRDAASKPGADQTFEPPWTTMHIGTISGGTAHNITARDCVFPTDLRILPGDDSDQIVVEYRAFAAEIEREMKAINPTAGISIEIKSSIDGCRPEMDGAAEALVRQLTGDNGQHVVAYGTEAGQFQSGGYSTVVCGPGSIEQAHRADEYISLDQLEKGVAFQRRLIEHLSK